MGLEKHTATAVSATLACHVAVVVTAVVVIIIVPAVVVVTHLFKYFQSQIAAAVGVIAVTFAVFAVKVAIFVADANVVTATATAVLLLLLPTQFKYFKSQILSVVVCASFVV